MFCFELSKNIWNACIFICIDELIGLINTRVAIAVVIQPWPLWRCIKKNFYRTMCPQSFWSPKGVSVSAILIVFIGVMFYEVTTWAMQMKLLMKTTMPSHILQRDLLHLDALWVTAAKLCNMFSSMWAPAFWWLSKGKLTCCIIFLSCKSFSCSPIMY